MQLKTVNVVESFSETVQGITSFSDDEEGNKEAEELFAELAKEQGFDDEEILVGLEDGLSRYNYSLYIIHS